MANKIKTFAFLILSIAVIAFINLNYERPVYAVEAINGYVVKSGISYSEQWGPTVATVVYENGKIVKVLLDGIRQGKSSKELREDYGIRDVSSIGKEWWEQVEFLEGWIEKNGIEKLKVNAEGFATNADVITSATIHIDHFKKAVENAINSNSQNVAVVAHAQTETSSNNITSIINVKEIYDEYNKRSDKHEPK